MDQSVTAPCSERIHWTTDDIEKVIQSTKVVVFSKGNRANPRCGYSKRALAAVERCGKPFDVIDVSVDRSISAALQAYAGRKGKLPVIFVDGAIVGSSETLDEITHNGELSARVEKAFS